MGISLPESRMKRAAGLLPLLVLALVAGPAAAQSPGAPAGKVHLIKGLFGVFSVGMDHLDERCRAAGVPSKVESHANWRLLADEIAQAHQTQKLPRPLVLIGHSYGADAALLVAQRLDELHVPVDLVITVDPVIVSQVPANVKHTVNFFRSKGILSAIPVWRGIPIEKAKGAPGSLHNIDVRNRPDLAEPGTSHVNIDDSALLHKAIMTVVLNTCRPPQQPPQRSAEPELVFRPVRFEKK